MDEPPKVDTMAQGAVPVGDLRERSLFALKFLLFAAGALFITGSGWVEENILLPFSELNAKAASVFLNHLGLEHSVTGDILSYRGRSVRVSTECSAVQVFAIYGAAVLAFPKSWSQRVTGVVFGFAAIGLVNVLRIAGLFGGAVYAPGGFEAMHVYAGQAFVIGATFMVWLMYLNGVFSRNGFTRLKQSTVFRRTAIFLLCMVIGLPVYSWFSGSDLAFGVSGSMVAAAGLVLEAAGMEVHRSGTVIGVPGFSVNAVSSCLAPPFLVIFYSFLFASGLKWKHKMFVTLLSLPVLYLLGVAKVSSFFLAGGTEGLKQGFVYNHYYPAFISGSVVGLAIFSVFGGDKRTAFGYSGLVAAGALFFYGLWQVVERAYMDWMLAPALWFVFGVESISFDPFTVLSSMPAYQIPLLASLMLFLPDATEARNLKRTIGFLAVLFFYQVVVIGGLNLFPVPVRAGYLRLLALIPPLAIWGWFLYRIATRQTVEEK